MSNKKNLLVASLAALGLVGLGSCGGDTDYDLTIWCPSDYNTTLNTIIENFKASNSEYADLNIGITGNISEGDVGASLQTDYASAGDILFMADDNLRTGAEAGALLPMTDEIIEDIVEQSGEAGLEAVTLQVYIENPEEGEENLQENTYGIPYRNDNGYVLIYDSALLTAEQAGSMESILEVCAENGYDFWYPISNSWYTPSFLWAAGGEFTTVVNEDGTVEIESNFGTQAVADGAQAISDLYKQYGRTTTGGGWLSDDSQSSIEAGFQAGTTAACVLWNDVSNIKAVVGEDRADDIKATVLPTIEINGEAQSLQTFLGYKAVGVNARVVTEYTDDAEMTRYNLAMAFAQYVTSTASQKLFLDELGYGPSDMSLFDDANVTGNDFLNALSSMSTAGHTVAQGVNVTNDFWTPIENFGAYIRDYAQTDSQWGSYSSALEAIQSIILASTGWVTTD